MHKTIKYILLAVIILVNNVKLFAQGSEIALGAYYFDGWTGAYPSHITQTLIDSFPEREPKWGWKTSSQEIVDEQIILAAKAGLSFFSFCWYYNGAEKFKTEPLNQAQRLFLKSPEKNKLKYCLLVANHQGFEISPSDWSIVTSEWINQFKDPSYLRVDGKPLLIFFSSLISKFGTADAVGLALNNFREAAKKAGLNGVTIALCTNPDETAIKDAELCGFDVLTGYNYHTAGYGNSRKLPINNLINGEFLAWNRFSKFSKLKYIPVVTLNWDARPWATPDNTYSTSPYYVGYSPGSVFKSVQNCIGWLNTNVGTATKERVAILYAWNEIGEGPYLTPSKNGINMLEGVKKALLFQLKSTTGP